jgi:hypothetical protein
MAKTPHLNLYLLLKRLWAEADQVPFTCFLLANDKLGAYKKNSLSFTSSLFALWKNFDQGYYDSVNSLHDDRTDIISDHYTYALNKNIR